MAHLPDNGKYAAGMAEIGAGLLASFPALLVLWEKRLFPPIGLYSLRN